MRILKFLLLIACLFFACEKADKPTEPEEPQHDQGAME